MTASFPPLLASFVALQGAVAIAWLGPWFADERRELLWRGDRPVLFEWSAPEEPEVATGLPIARFDEPVRLRHQVGGFATYLHWGGGRTRVRSIGPREAEPRPFVDGDGAEDELALIAYPGQLPIRPHSVLPRERQFRFVLANSGASSKTLLAAEWRTFGLPIFQEALDERGEWQVIEEDSVFCGTHAAALVSLPARHQWEFGAIRYGGTFPTRLRLRMETSLGTLYSNEFYGAVDPVLLGGNR